MNKKLSAVLVAVSGVLVSVVADAHVSIASGPGFANTTQEVVFGVGHGCNNADTYGVKIEIPNGITSVRPMRSDFGKTSVDKDGAGNVTAVTWQKPDADALDSDTNYYKLVIRMKLPNTSFTTLYFKVHQTCRAADGTLSTVDWVGLPTDPDAGVPVEPAAPLIVVPAHVPGWNEMTVSADVKDLSVYFKDALIVWKGTAAYSANPVTAAQIKAEAGVTPLTELKAGDKVMVKY